MKPSDTGHRPHADFKGQFPRNPISRGPDALEVTLDTWGPREWLFTTIYNALQANWGNDPSHVELLRPGVGGRTGWSSLSEEQQAYVRSCFEGKTLPQIKELVTFAFTIDGVSRACTHQLVRTRIGAAFMQHGGRDNDWRHRAWTLPETIARTCDEFDGLRDVCLCSHPVGFHSSDLMGACECCDCERYEQRESPISDRLPIGRLLQKEGRQLADVIERYLAQGRQIYAALVDSGVPWQDARRLLWMGTQTYIHAIYNYAALESFLANRLEHVMDWEINCVAQLMLREIRMKCPGVLSAHLGSHSDRAKKAMYAGLESWSPDQKWPTSEIDLARSRTHRAEQNPFWVLAPESRNGGPIRWIATNGVYPQDLPR